MAKIALIIDYKTGGSVITFRLTQHELALGDPPESFTLEKLHDDCCGDPSWRPLADHDEHWNETVAALAISKLVQLLQLAPLLPDNWTRTDTPAGPMLVAHLGVFEPAP